MARPAINWPCWGSTRQSYSPTDNLDVFKTRVGLSGVSPTSAHVGKFVVVLRPLDSGDCGPAVVAGVVPVRVYVNSTDDKACDVIAVETVDGEDCYLGTGGSGAKSSGSIRRPRSAR